MEYKANDWKMYLYSEYVDYFKTKPNLKEISFDEVTNFFGEFFEIIKNGDENSINSYQKILIVTSMTRKLAEEIRFEFTTNEYGKKIAFPYYEWDMPISTCVKATYRYEFSKIYLADNSEKKNK